MQRYGVLLENASKAKPRWPGNEPETLGPTYLLVLTTSSQGKSHLDPTESGSVKGNPIFAGRERAASDSSRSPLLPPPPCFNLIS